MLNFQPFGISEASIEEAEAIPSPHITVVESDEHYGKFVAEPIHQGYGRTLGNPLRRVLYSSLPGTAITWVKIEGILHEYTTIPCVTEEVSQFLLNVKEIRLRSEVDRPGKLRLEVAGQGEVCAGDIMASTDFQIVNPQLHLATLDSEEAKLSVEFNVAHGTGYEAAAIGDGLPIGVLPVDAVYTPVRKVNYVIENVRVGQKTDFERLILEVWTDGSITPTHAVRQAGSRLVEEFFLFANTKEEDEDGGQVRTIPISPEKYNTPVEELDLSSRTLNCLKRANIDKAGQILEMEKSDLLQIRNFGEKSMKELYDQLRERELLPPEFDPELNLENSPETPDNGGDESGQPLDVEILPNSENHGGDK